MRLQYWDASQIKVMAKQLRKDIGGGWKWLVPEVRSAIVDSRVLSIVQGQHKESVPRAEIRELHNALHAEMGTGEFEG